jgi:hypothetical protein
MILDEVGPWRVERAATVVTRWTIGLTPSTTYNLFMRVNAPRAFAGISSRPSSMRTTWRAGTS